MRLCLLLLSTFLTDVFSYKILGVFPLFGKSHIYVFQPIMEGLAAKGHDVTVLSLFPMKKTIKNYNHIDLSDGINGTMDVSVSMDTSLLDNGLARIITPIFLHMVGVESCKLGLGSKNFQRFLEIQQDFDVLIIEFFNTDCFLGLAHKFQAKIIGLSSCTNMAPFNARIGNPSNPAYIPNNLLIYSDRMNFFSRVHNAFMDVLHNVFYELVSIRNSEWYAKEIFGNDLPSISEIIKNTSLILVNSHFSLTLPRPVVPGFVEIGGVHVQKPNKLRKDLEKWINESRDGVIYFSLGSMIKGHTFPQEKRIEFLKAFARLPQRVLWKWESDEMPGKPDNVMIQKWMPQLDILCHPNVKAFISHGGLLGTTEAVHCGVPTVVMPQYGDQHTNAKALEANGGGVILQLREASEENVYAALKKVLDPEFRKGAQELSSRFKDRPLPPLETAIYWVEYVARHRGAKHMRTAAVDMPLYQYLLLDVIAFLLVVIGIVSYAIFYLIRAVLRKVFKKSPPKQKSQ